MNPTPVIPSSPTAADARQVIHFPGIAPGRRARLGARMRAGAPELVAAPVLFCFAVLLQWLGGAYAAEFGGHADEPAHYVTGLMVRDYMVSYPWSSPIAFAESYYLHYPKVGLGHWPPFFYLTQAFWTLALPPSRPVLLGLMALIAALLATVVFRVVRREFGWGLGLAAAVLLLALPAVQWTNQRIMSDVLVTLLSFAAVLWFGRYLEAERWHDSLLFGLFASAAILTKGSALALVLVPPIAILLRRQWHVLLRPSLWLSAMVVVVLCGPWQLFAMRVAEGAWQGEAGWEYTRWMAVLFPRTLLNELGVGLALFAVIGLGWLAAARGKPSGRWAAAVALLVAVWLLHAAVPTGFEPRFLIQAVPPVIMLVAAGIAWTAQRLPFSGVGASRRLTAVALLAAVVFAAGTFTLPRKAKLGFDGVAQTLLSHADLQDAVFLVASDAEGEGAFIAEVAMREARPGHVVLRATKALSSADWVGRDYSLRYEEPEELQAFLETLPVGVLVVDRTAVDPAGGRIAHIDLLQAMLAQYSDRWQPVASSRTGGADAATRLVEAYRLRGLPASLAEDRAARLDRLREFARP